MRRCAQDRGLTIEVDAPRGPIPFGTRTVLTVRRTWPRSHVVEDFDVRGLAPLRARIADVQRKESSTEVRETIVLHAWAFQDGKVAVPALPLRAVPRTGGAVRTANSAPFDLTVEALAHDRTIELPGPPMPAPTGLPWTWIAGGTVATAIVAIVAWRRQRVARIESLTMREQIERDLASIRAQSVTSFEAAHEEGRALSALLRRYLEQRYKVPATRQTTDEFLDSMRDVDRLPATIRTALTDFLELTDRVKFGAHAPTDDERRAVHETVDRVLAAEPAGEER